MNRHSTSLEPLLYLLHAQSRGSWNQFVHALNRFDEDADPWAMARGLCEHALVEFHWDLDRRWSVTSTTAVITDRADTRIALWGGTHRTADKLGECGVLCDVDERRIISRGITYTYKQGVRVSEESRDLLRAQNVRLVHSTDLLDTLPVMSEMLSRAPVCPPPSSSASTYRYVYRLAKGSNFNSEPFVAESPSLWRVGFRRFLFVGAREINRVPEWLGKWCLYAAERRQTYAALFARREEMLVLPFAPVLPAPYVRCLFFAGAVERFASQFGTRCFANVPADLAASVCSKLGIDLEMIDHAVMESA